MGEYKFNPFTKTLDITGEALIHLKDPVDTYNDLPIEGNSENDARFVKDTDDLYVWTISSPKGDLSDWKKIPLLSNIKLDDIKDGDNYARVRKGDLVSGRVSKLSNGAEEVVFNEIKESVDLSGNVMEKIGEVEVSSNCSYVEFTGLDGNSDWFYKLFAIVKRSDGNDGDIYLFVNGDTTISNYWHQGLNALGSNVTGGRYNKSMIGWVSSFFTEVSISRDVNGIFRAVAYTNFRESDGIRFSIYGNCKTASISNITSLRIQSDIANGIGVGSKFILFRMRRG